jgi:hypothetical protein
MHSPEVTQVLSTVAICGPHVACHSVEPEDGMGCASVRLVVEIEGITKEKSAMPAGSSKKRERQYAHIKESYQGRGVSKDEAEERAARTVNKARREQGETKKD